MVETGKCEVTVNDVFKRIPASLLAIGAGFAVLDENGDSFGLVSEAGGRLPSVVATIVLSSSPQIGRTSECTVGDDTGKCASTFASCTVANSDECHGCCQGLE